MSYSLLNNYTNLISRENTVLSHVIKINHDDISKINHDDISKINHDDISKINHDDISNSKETPFLEIDNDGYVSEIDDIIILNIVDKSIKNKQFIVGLDQNIMGEEQRSNTFISTLSSIVNGLLFSKLGREVLYAGTMYMAGSTIIATVGFLPVVATGAAIYLL